MIVFSRGLIVLNPFFDLIGDVRQLRGVCQADFPGVDAAATDRQELLLALRAHKVSFIHR